MPQQHNPGRHVQSLTLPQSRHNHRNTSAYIFPTVPTPRTTPPTPGTASPRRRPLRSNSPSQRSRAIQDTPLPPNTDPTSSRHLGPPPTPGHASPPGTAPPLRRAPTLQLPVATLPCHSRHSPAAEHRPHFVPTPRPPADTGPRLAAGHCPASPPGPNAPTPRRNAPAPFKAHTCRRTPVPTAPTPRTTPPTPGHASPPGPNAPTPRRNAPAPFKTHPCRRTTAPHRPNPRTTPPAQDSTAPPGTKKSGSASRTYSFVSNFSVKNRRLHLAQTNALTQHNQSGAYPLINPCSHN